MKQTVEYKLVFTKVLSCSGKRYNATPKIQRTSTVPARKTPLARTEPRNPPGLPALHLLFLHPLRRTSVKLARMLQAEFCQPVTRFNKYMGLPFKAGEIEAFIEGELTNGSR